MIAGCWDDKGRHGLSAMLGQHCHKSGAGVGLDVGHQGVSFYNVLILFDLAHKEHGTLNPMIQAGGEGQHFDGSGRQDSRLLANWDLGVSVFGFHMI